MLLGKTRRWVLCLSVFLCFLSPCKICVPVVFTGTSLPCGQGATSGTQEVAELLSVIRARINWQRRLIGLLLLLQGRCFSRYRGKDDTLSKGAGVRGNSLAASDLARACSGGWGGCSALASATTGKSRFAESLLELMATPQSGVG